MLKLESFSVAVESYKEGNQHFDTFLTGGYSTKHPQKPESERNTNCQHIYLNFKTDLNFSLNELKEKNKQDLLDYRILKAHSS